MRFGQFYQRRAQAWVTVFGHTALQALAPAGVFAGTETGVTGNLATIVKPAPIADLAVDHDTGHLPAPPG